MEVGAGSVLSWSSAGQRHLLRGLAQRSMVPATFLQLKLVLGGLAQWSMVPGTFV